ncbi:MAG: hypothetical protein ACLPWD_04830 [Methanobacterium sp.]
MSKKIQLKFEESIINDTIIEPKIKNIGDKRTYAYCNEFNHPYPNIFLCAKKNSGKTVLLTNLIDLCADKKNTMIRIFSTTYQNDPDFLKYIETRIKQGYHIECYSTIDYANKKGEMYRNIIDKQLSEIDAFLENPKKSEKFFSLKKQIPLILYIFDDFRISLRENKFLNDIATRNRHYKCILIYSSQRFYDVSPIVRCNLNVLILFRGMNEKNLECVYEECINTAHMTYDQFVYLYNLATKEPYHFLYIDTDKEEFRKNLNLKYEIKIEPIDEKVDDKKL